MFRVRNERAKAGMVLPCDILVTKGKTWSAVDGERSDISLLLRINNCMHNCIQLFIVGYMSVSVQIANFGIFQIVLLENYFI